MSDPRLRQPKPAQNILPDLIIPLLALVFTLYYVTTILDVPWIAQASAVTVSGLLLLAVIAYGVRTVYRIRQGRECIRLSQLGSSAGLQLKRLLLLALTIAYVYFIELTGFTLTTFGFLFLAILLLSTPGNWRNALKVALACSLVGYLVFIYLFQTRFPKGPLEVYLDRLL